MSWGYSYQIGVDVSVTSYVAFTKDNMQIDSAGHLLLEDGFALLQEDRSLILLEP